MKQSTPSAFTHDCIIVGGGPAGLTAALYLRRVHRNVVVIDRGASRVQLAPRIRNLVAHPAGIPGRVLLKRLRRQIALYDTPLIFADATIRRRRRGFDVLAGDRVFRSRFVILATGVRDRQPALINHRELCAKGLLAYCPICDGFEHTGEKIGVLIDSKAGIGKAHFLSRFTKRLHVIAIKNFSVSPRTRNTFVRQGIVFHQGVLESLAPTRGGDQLTVKLSRQRPFDLPIVYVEMGFKVPHEAVRHLRGLKTARDGRFLMTRHQQTSIRGLYVAGDCTNSLAQVSVAVGEAAIAATDVHNQLRKAERREQLSR